MNVAARFLADIPDIEDGTRQNVANFMAFAHESVTDASRR